jgi:hypothetical protein
LTANPGTSGNTYQWYKNGSIISGATNRTHTSTTSTTTNYTVRVTNSCGNSISLPCTVTINCREGEAVALSKTFSVQIFPNPFSDILTVEIQSENESLSSIRVYDMLGNEKISIQDIRPGEAIEIGDHLTAGVYMIDIRQGNNQQTLRIIKTN